MAAYDFAVIGGGVIGLSLARTLKQRHGDARIVLLDKEGHPGVHASGRNSGVLHAGFYYTPDSLKARFTRQGNAALRAYCEQRGLPINHCGKLVVTQDETEHARLDELLRRGRANGIEIEEVDEAAAREIEPRAKTCGRALFSPTTSSVDPRRVVQAMHEDATAAGIETRYGCAYLGRTRDSLRCTGGEITAGYTVNAAGLYADHIARDYGFSQRYRIVPFKGLYLYSSEPVGALRTHIYPVPDLRNPFLGVHFTITVDGHIKIGPTAIPAFWREQYNGFSGFRASELFDIARTQSRLFLRSNFDFKRLAVEEFKKHSRTRMASLAGRLATGVDPRHYLKWGPPGIRAQLVDVEKSALEMDFVLEGDDRSMHVLNAVSPAFTCSIPFAEHVCDEISRRLN